MAEAKESIVSIICRTQGVGVPIAESVASKLSREQVTEIERLAGQGGTSQEILALLRPEELKPIVEAEADQTGK